MRHKFSFNKKWAFRKGVTEIPSEMRGDWDIVNLPHTWNAIDGQDGGNDYYRGVGCYVKTLERGELPEAEKYFLEICGANSSAEVYLNGKALARHDGGYSTFRVDITDVLERENLFVIKVDNSPSEEVYPQAADFTFYGGLYRDVNILCVGRTHFDLEYFGGFGLWLTPTVREGDGILDIKTKICGDAGGERYHVTVYDKSGDTVAEEEFGESEKTLKIPEVKLWRGVCDPYLYTVRCELVRDGEILDAVSDRVGFRTFEVDAERGFILNGEEYPLRGVSRHQDRLGKGNALSAGDHDEDIDLICEVGANTVRLAHYQHDRHFYDLCDERGLVVWAEIPYISNHMPRGRENTVTQMKELIVQNYNHPSIAFWGLSNEITMKGDRDEDLIENHRVLNDLCHKMDKNRLTAIAVVSPCPIDSPYLGIPDVVAYNHYFGWYGGETSMNGEWFDKFHKENPKIPIGCSEYGCEALNWHTSTPTQGDYTEEYQAYYHEELIKQLFTRKYLFATYVWNMFDFGADARCEGGENGQNHKGLVTFDRKYKKDAFYAYKAWLSKEPFVHICGKRYVEREGDTTRITVYSNQPTVELYINNECVGRERSEDHFFYFTVKNEGESRVVARAGVYKDESKFCHVDKFNEAYRLKEKSAVLNWFDVTEREGYLSLNDKLSVIMATEGGRRLMDGVFSKVQGGDVAGFEMTDAMRDMMGGFTLIRLVGMMGAMGLKMSKEELLSLNSELNEISRA